MIDRTRFFDEWRWPRVILAFSVCFLTLLVTSEKAFCVGELRAPSEDWVIARAMSVGEYRDVFFKIKHDVDKWISTQTDKPEYIAGWAHDYVDHKSGRFIAWVPYRLPPPEYNEKVFGAWVANFRFHNIEVMRKAAKLYRITGDKRYLNWISRQLKVYSSAYRSWPLREWNGFSRLFSQSIDEAVYVIQLVDVVRLLRDDFEDGFIDQLRKDLFIPVAENLIKSSHGVHNISVWSRVAEAIIGVEFADENLFFKAVNSPRGLFSLLKDGLGEDHFWQEGSIAYHDYVVRALYEFALYMHLRGRHEVAQRVSVSILAMLQAPLLVRFPDGSAPAINNSPPRRSVPNLSLWRDVNRVVATEVGFLEVHRKKDIDFFIDPAVFNGSSAQLPTVESRLIPGLRTGVLSTSEAQVLFRYGHKVKTHAHRDVMSYDLYSMGLGWVSRDQGAVGYGARVQREYFQSDVAHNVPLVDGEGQQTLPTTADILEFDSSSVEMVVDKYRNGVSVGRRLKISGSRLEDGIRFLSQGGAKRSYGMVFNTECRPQIHNLSLIAFERKLPKTAAFSYWEVIGEVEISPSFTLRLTCARGDISISFSVNGYGRVVLANVPSTMEGSGRWGFFIELSGKADEVKTIIDFGE